MKESFFLFTSLANKISVNKYPYTLGIFIYQYFRLRQYLLYLDEKQMIEERNFMILVLW